MATGNGAAVKPPTLQPFRPIGRPCAPPLGITRRPMTDPTRATDGDDLILLALVAGWATLQALATLTVALVALLLTLAGWRPAAAPAARPAPLPVVLTPAPAPLALPPAAAPPLASLRVIELRQLARAAGLATLARSGRRADLLEALALAA